MHVVFVTVSVKDGRLADAEEGLRTMVVPSASQSPGFKRGTWWHTPDGTTGYSLVVFEDEESAKHMAAQVAAPPGDAPVSIRSVEVAPLTVEA